MGEILRAIMERNCTYSQTSFFSIPLSLTSTIGAKSFARRQGSAQWKTDCWYLIQGWAQFSLFSNAATRGWATRGEPSTFVLQRSSNSEAFEFSGPAPKSNHNDNLNNFVSLPEYPLLAPGDLLTVIEDLQVTDPGVAFSHTTTLTMQGVEFYMPPSKQGTFRNG